MLAEDSRISHGAGSLRASRDFWAGHGHGQVALTGGPGWSHLVPSLPPFLSQTCTPSSGPAPSSLSDTLHGVNLGLGCAPSSLGIPFLPPPASKFLTAHFVRSVPAAASAVFSPARFRCPRVLTSKRGDAARCGYWGPGSERPLLCPLETWRLLELLRADSPRSKYSGLNKTGGEKATRLPLSRCLPAPSPFEGHRGPFATSRARPAAGGGWDLRSPAPFSSGQ